MPDMKKFSSIRKLPEIYTIQEIETLLDSFNRKTRTGNRDYCMCRLALETGMRENEITSLRWRDITEDEEGSIQIRVHGKRAAGERGPAVRFLFLKKDMLFQMQMMSNQMGFTENGHVFRTCKGEKLSNSQLRTLMVRKGQEVIGRKINFHMFRHTCLTRITRQYGIAHAQKVAGHRNIQTTAIYTHLDNRDVKEALLGDEVPVSRHELPGQIRLDGSVAG